MIPLLAAVSPVISGLGGLAGMGGSPMPADQLTQVNDFVDSKKLNISFGDFLTGKSDKQMDGNKNFIYALVLAGGIAYLILRK